MPYISVRTTVDIKKQKEEELKTKLGKAIEIFPGKTESYLMVDITGGCNLYFRGDNLEETAFVEVKILGKSDRDIFTAMTAEICSILQSVINVPSNRVYVKYEEVTHWGFNGSNF